MHAIAEELNNVLKGTPIYELLSEFGRRIYFPKGIAAQAAEATNLADLYNATVGMAESDRAPFELPSMRNLIPNLQPADAVAYAPNAGMPELRSLWKKEIQRKNPGVELETLPTVTAGITHGISLLADLFVDPGDVVLVPDLLWGNYRLIFEARKKAKIVTFPFFNETKGLNTEGFLRCLKDNRGASKIILILNFPNNPRTCK